MTQDQENSGNERLEAVPERDQLVGFAGLQRQHGVVMDARFLDVRQLRQKKAEVHGVSPSVWLNAIQRKPADPEFQRVKRVAAQFYSLPSDKGKVKRHMGQLSGSGMGHSLSAFGAHVAVGAMRAMLATRGRANARHRCVRTALIKVHGENNYGAHRLPAGKTAAKEYGAGVLLVRRRN
jgi:hypothetical protein